VRAAALLLLAGCASTTSPAAARPAYECRTARGPLALDGLLDEPAWAEAVVIDRFWAPGQGRASKTATRARLLWDAEALWFAAEMEDVDLYATVKDRDGMLWENDVFELFFMPPTARGSYYEFQVGAAGAVLDMFLPSRGAGGYFRFVKGDLGLRAQVRLKGTLNAWDERDEGWTAEGRIPWTAFAATGGAPAAGDVWRFALCRYDYSVAHDAPELSSCAPLTERNFHRYEDYADLRFSGATPR
jgi:hypothetical protein